MYGEQPLSIEHFAYQISSKKTKTIGNKTYYYVMVESEKKFDDDGETIPLNDMKEITFRLITLSEDDFEHYSFSRRNSKKPDIPVVNYKTKVTEFETYYDDCI